MKKGPRCEVCGERVLSVLGTQRACNMTCASAVIKRLELEVQQAEDLRAGAQGEFMAAIERLRGEIVNRNRRALEGDKAVEALGGVHNYYEGLEAEVAQLKSDLQYLWCSLPEERKLQPPEGLCPTMYLTGSYDGDCEVAARMKAIHDRAYGMEKK